MKGELQVLKSIVRRAHAEGIGDITAAHVRIAEAMAGYDTVEIRRTGTLTGARRQAIAATASASMEEIDAAAQMFARWLQPASDDQLRQAGINIKELPGGMTLVEYDEHFVNQNPNKPADDRAAKPSCQNEPRNT